MRVIMKHKLAWIGAILSALYLLTIGILPDPILLIDEGIAFAIFLKCTQSLGYDFRKYIPFFRNRQRSRFIHSPKS
jgi:hypothetical protein